MLAEAQARDEIEADHQRTAATRPKIVGVRSSHDADYVRVSVNLVREVAEALRNLAESSGVSITEAVRRAINLLVVVDKATRSGARLQLVTDGPHGREVETLHFL